MNQKLNNRFMKLIAIHNPERFVKVRDMLEGKLRCPYEESYYRAVYNHGRRIYG